MARTEPCQACGGTGQIEIPSIEDKVAHHLMMAPAYGLQLTPDEVIELGQVLGLTPPHPPCPVCLTPLIDAAHALEHAQVHCPPEAGDGS